MPHIFRNPSVPPSLAAGLALLAAAFPPPAFAAEPGDGNGKTTVVFVCLHGSVKSQMAAAHFNRIASERGLPYAAVSRGIEADASIPTRIRDGLYLDGLAPTDDIPIGLTADEAGRATVVVARGRGARHYRAEWRRQDHSAGSGFRPSCRGFGRSCLAWRTAAGVAAAQRTLFPAGWRAPLSGRGDLPGGV